MSQSYVSEWVNTKKGFFSYCRTLVRRKMPETSKSRLLTRKHARMLQRLQSTIQHCSNWTGIVGVDP